MLGVFPNDPIKKYVKIVQGKSNLYMREIFWAKEKAKKTKKYMKFRKTSTICRIFGTCTTLLFFIH